MVSQGDYTGVLFNTNFIRGAGKSDLSTVSAATDIRAEVINIKGIKGGRVD